MQQLTGTQFSDIGIAMFGQNWRNAMAEHLGLSYARVSQLAIADELSTKSSARVLQLHAAWRNGNDLSAPIGLVVDEPIFTTDDPDANLTDEQILNRVSKRFAVMDRMVDGMIAGIVRSMIVAGAPGIGKTYNLERKVKQAHREQGLEYTMIRGTCSAPGLYQALYRARNGGITVIDDSDTILNDEQTFNILKAALDTTNERTISWRKQAAWVYDVNSEDATTLEVVSDRFPNEFIYNGAVVFITNLNFREIVMRGGRFAPHLNALLSRSMYLDLTLHSKRSRILRMKEVFFSSMVETEHLTSHQAAEVFSYATKNSSKMNELSLRSLKHICTLYKMGDGWQDIVEATLFV